MNGHRWFRVARTGAKLRVILGLILLLTGLRSGAQSAPDAQQAPPSISLSPSVIMLQGKPGQSTAQTVHLSNHTPVPLSFEMVAMDAVTHAGKRAFATAGETPQSIAATAVFSARAVTVNPNQTADVKVTLTVPEQSAIRAVAVIFKGTDRIATSQKTQGTASLGALVTFTLNQDFEAQGDPAVVTAQTKTSNAIVVKPFTNTGTDPLVLKGVAVIVNDTGTLVTKAPFESTRLLPGEHLELKTEIPIELKPGHYRAFTSFICAENTITDSTAFIID